MLVLIFLTFSFIYLFYFEINRCQQINNYVNNVLSYTRVALKTVFICKKNMFFCFKHLFFFIILLNNNIHFFYTYFKQFFSMMNTTIESTSVVLFRKLLDTRHSYIFFTVLNFCSDITEKEILLTCFYYFIL